MKCKPNQKCENCPCCQLVTATFNNIANLDESEYYYQCTGDVESECLNGESINIKIEDIKKWFKTNYTFDDEEYNTSSVECLDDNKFRLVIESTGEIKDMYIPINDFEEFKKLQDEYSNLDNRQEELYDEVYNNNSHFIFESEIENELNNNKEYLKNEKRLEEIQAKFKELQK